MSVRSDLGLGAPLPSLLRYPSWRRAALAADGNPLRKWPATTSSTSPAARDHSDESAMNCTRVRPGAPGDDDRPRPGRRGVAQRTAAAAGSRGCRRWSRSWPEAACCRAPRPGYAALALLDALQPRRDLDLVLDPHSLTPALGAAAARAADGQRPRAGVGHFRQPGHGRLAHGRGQIRPGGGCASSSEREGTAPVEGEVRLWAAGGGAAGAGRTGRLTVRPQHGFDVGFGAPGKAGVMRVTGGALGLIMDARGRPLVLPRDAGPAAGAQPEVAVRHRALSSEPPGTSSCIPGLTWP